MIALFLYFVFHVEAVGSRAKRKVPRSPPYIHTHIVPILPKKVNLKGKSTGIPLKNGKVEFYFSSRARKNNSTLSRIVVIFLFLQEKRVFSCITG